MADPHEGPLLLLTGQAVTLPDGDAVVRGPAGEVRLTGPHAGAFCTALQEFSGQPVTVLRLLTADLRIPAESVDGFAADLIASGLLVELPDAAASSPARQALAALGLGQEAFNHLQQATVAAVGTEPVILAALADLADYGVGRLVLAQPGPQPSSADENVDRLRDGLPASARFTTHPVETMESFADVAAGSQFLLAGLDRATLGAAHWMNRTSLQTGIPSIYGTGSGHRGFAGPLVLPGEGPCLLCYRMRAVACEPDFSVAMALEEAPIRPSAMHAPALPNLVRETGGMIALEILRTLTGLAPPLLAAAVHETDVLSSSRRIHHVLQRADCPACRKKDPPPHRPQDEAAAVDLTALADILVSPHCGILRALEPLPPDVTEPDVPVVRSEVANNRFHLPDQMPFQSCSGKGMTGSQAITGAVGEGCERYGASSWLDDDLTRARPDQLDTAAVLPFELVLFHPDQYAHLPYRPWDPKAELTWVDGFDAASGAPVAVPAVHALLGYAGGSADHLFASTSNGLAAGRTAAQALTAAALEVIERDAYLLSWFHRRPGTRIDPRTLNHPTVATLTEAYQRRMISLELYRLPTDVTAVSVYAAIAVQHSDRAVGRGPAAVVGLGADLEDRDAAAKAVLEIAQVRPALKARMRDPATLARQRELVNDPSRVEHLEDHDLLYGHPEALPWLDFWRQQPPTPWSDPHQASPGSRYERLLRSLADNGHRLIGCNLTPPELGQLGVHVMRATIPNFQPIHFGANEARLGGERLFTRGDGARTVQSELNLLPHPIS